MKVYYKKRGIWLMLAAVLTITLALTGCGVDSPTGTTVTTGGGVVVGGAATVGLKVCTSCHTVQTEDWLLTRHANVEPIGNLYSAGNPTLGQVPGACAACHDQLGDSGQLATNYTGTPPRPVVGCESCHGGGSLHVAAGGAGPIGAASVAGGMVGATPVSAQFNTCTACHALLDSTGTGSASAAHNLASTVSPTGNDYVITDTHFAAPGDWTGFFDGSSAYNKKNVTGYAMDYASETVCTDCHNPHKTADINREWALSAHADKYAHFPPDPATHDPLGYFSSAWAHYDWTVASRRVCQRCHTTTAFAAYANALGSGDAQAAANIRNGQVSFFPSTAFKPEMLKCNGCHKDNKGTLRNPGAITANYDYPIPVTTLPNSIASYAYPDVKGSNVCMACHTARESGETVKGLNDPALLSSGTITFFDFSRNGLINSHYLTAGGTVFAATGFEFDGRTYENPGTYRHVKIGTSAEPNTGTNGPCIGCHMSRPGKSGNHLFLPVTRSTNTLTPGHIDGIASEVCINCHTVSGAGGLEDLINERKEEYRESVEAAIYVLDKRGAYFRQASPYMFALRTKGTTASVANGSNLVTVASTANVAGVETSRTPDYFKVDSDGTYYRVTSVINGTTLQLDKNYAGPTGAGLAYSIIQTSTSGLRSGSTTTTATALVTNGSPTVIITGPLYSSGSVTICPTTCSLTLPDYFKVTGVEPDYQITKVSDNGINTSTITLSKAYEGATNAATGFSILKSGQTGLRDWRTKSGSGIVPATASDTDTSGRTTGRYNMGAAFNVNLLEHDPGGYVHNRIYSKRLLYDSIDWADDNQLNFSVGTTLRDRIDGAIFTWKAGAMKYLLPNGVLGISAERP